MDITAWVFVEWQDARLVLEVKRVNKRLFASVDDARVFYGLDSIRGSLVGGPSDGGSGVDRGVRGDKIGGVRSDGGGGDIISGSGGGGEVGRVSVFPSAGVVGGPAWQDLGTGGIAFAM